MADTAKVAPDVTLTLSINPVLFADLQAAAAMCEITPQRFASEAVEAILAERRLAKPPPRQVEDKPEKWD